MKTYKSQQIVTQSSFKSWSAVPPDTQPGGKENTHLCSTWLINSTQLHSTTGAFLTGAMQQVLSRRRLVTHHTHGGA